MNCIDIFKVILNTENALLTSAECTNREENAIICNMDILYITFELYSDSIT